MEGHNSWDRVETEWEFCNRQTTIYQELCRTQELPVSEVKRWLTFAVDGIFHKFNLALLYTNNPSYQTVRNFLSIRGPIWQAAFFLNSHEADIWISVNEPAIGLLNRSALDQSLVAINPINYLIAQFLSHLTLVSVRNQLDEATSSVYVSLLQEYAQEFLPSNGQYASHLLDNIHPSKVLVSHEINKEDDWGISPIFNRNTLHSGARSPGTRIPVGQESLPIQETRTFIHGVIELWLRDLKECSQLRVIAVRFFLKQAHQFANSPSALNESSLKILKASLARLLAQDLYPFLKQLFQRWPLDASFRVVLETWLTFIQPWRYSSQGSVAGENDRWFGFIQGFWEFYSDFFLLATERLARMDLTSARNIQLLSRLTKVFCSDPVAHFLDSSPLKGSFKPHIQDMITCVEMAEADLKIRLAELELEAANEEEKRKSLWHRMFAEESSLDKSCKATQKLLSDLSYVAQSWASHFEIQRHSEGEVDLNRSRSDLDASFSFSVNDTIPDSIIDPSSNRAVLTSLGRKQVLSRSRKFNFDNSFDQVYPPDIAPVKSSEVGAITRWLCAASALATLRWKEHVQRLYQSHGTIARWILLPPSRDTAVGSPKILRTYSIKNPRLTPPRFIASVKFVAALSIFLLLSFGFKFSFLSSVILSAALIVCFLQCC